MIPGISIRPAVENDLNFILNSWVESYIDRDNGAVEVSRVRTSVLKAGHRRLVARLLAAEDTVTLVAHAEGSPDTIVGWSCVHHLLADRRRESTVHYVYVKSDFRGHGVAKLLLETVCADTLGLEIFPSGRHRSFRFSHYTRVVDEWRKKWEPRAVEFWFDPYAAMEVA